MTMGKGMITMISCKQILNTRSTTAAGVVAADEVYWTNVMHQKISRSQWIQRPEECNVSGQPEYYVT